MRLISSDTSASKSIVSAAKLVDEGANTPPPLPNTGPESEKVENQETSLLEQPATPKENWLLPADILGEYQYFKVVFEVWISASGEVERVELISFEPGDISAEARSQIEEFIQQTPMTPATFAGRAIESRKVIEVTFERDE